MKNIEDAITRLSEALERLEKSMGGLDAQSEAARNATLFRDERDKLAGHVGRLELRARNDAKLRAEAAQAVRLAVKELRGALGSGVEGNA